MELLCVGLSHKSAPLEVRERLALKGEVLEATLKVLAEGSTEAMVVSTCNRVEFYLAAPSTDGSRRRIQTQVASLGGAEALMHLYEHCGEGALVHLFRVAASLDSMVVGEPQILGQVKDAFELAGKMGAARGELSRTCAAAFGSAKRVRSETAIGRAAVSMASAAVELARKIFGDLSGKTVLIVGAGEMAELAAKHLAGAGAKRILVTNRTHQRAVDLAATVGGTAHPFEELPGLLVPVDVVITSTASPVPIFTRELVGSSLKARKYRRLLLVDLAVPRDVAPDVNTLENVYTADVDDIQSIVADNAATRAAEAAKAEAIVAEEVARFVRSRAVREGVPVLARLRARAEQIARAEVERTFANIGEGLTDKQRKSVEAMARAIVNKLLHQPTTKLRSVKPDDDRLADAAAELFGLDSEQLEGVAGAKLESPSALAAGGRQR